jgi:hypothetical protein
MKRQLILGSAALAGVLTFVQWGLDAQAPAQPAGQPAGQQGGAPAGRQGGAAGRQGGVPAAPQGPQTGQAAALGDLTGYWVSVVNQDWYFRMITPPKGQYAQVPLNAAARVVADQFDPAQYGGANYQTSGIVDCRAYGAAGLMHMPTRLHITWDSPDTLKIETDWGVQTRLLRFTPGRPYGDVEQAMRRGEVGTSQGPPSAQGHSAAMWEQPYRLNANQWVRGFAGRGGGLGNAGIEVEQPGGNLAVLTTNLTPGWLRRNGVPYGSRTRVIERFMTFQDPTGKDWINVVSEVIDPEYLNTPFLTTADFRKEPDGSKWAPHPCKKVG